MQTRVTDQPGFILRRREWQNTSLLLDLFTRDYGCIRVLARGARRNPARAQYQPFVALSLSWTGRHELKTLTGAEGQALSVDEHNYLSLLYVNELIGAFLPPQETNREVFDAYLDLLYCAALRIDEAELRRFELRLLRILGVFPDLNLDAESGTPIRPEAHYQFLINSGFVVCPTSAGNSVKGQVILDWQAGCYADSAVLRLAKSVLRSTIDFNLHGKALKSRDVYAEILKRK